MKRPGLVHGAIKKTNMQQMKKMFIVAAAVIGLLMAGTTTSHAQSKIGYISLADLIPTMPEYKKADTALADFQAALSQNFEDMKKEFNEQDSLLSSKDTLKYTKAQIEIKRKNLTELYLRVNGYQQQSQQQLQQKQQDLLKPIQEKAITTINAVAKENGYTYVLSKEALFVSPLADDLLPLVKKKLGLK
jgi:outer membrane protein